MKNLKQVRQQIVAEYAEVDVKVDVYFHNSNQANLVELNWLADNNSSVIGAFVHLGDDEYFNRYGNHTYAVVIDSEQGSIRGSILEDTGW